MFFASEIKALLNLQGDVCEFPAGHWWSAARGFVRYFHIDDLQWNTYLPSNLPNAEYDDLIRSTLRRAVRKRLIADPGIPVGVSLSGGLDSSLITALAREGRDVLDTFVVGMEGSEDVARSQEVADALGTRHHVYIYDFQEMLDVLPQVIYHLESFDAALVRSAIPNYFLARLASQHVKVMLTGEGADEIFGGYEYLSGVTDPHQFQHELWTITTNLHNTNLQRTDRMTMAHSIEGRVPFLDKEMIRLALSLPPNSSSTLEAELKKRFCAAPLPVSCPMEFSNAPSRNSPTAQARVICWHIMPTTRFQTRISPKRSSNIRKLPCAPKRNCSITEFSTSSLANAFHPKRWDARVRWLKAS